MELFIGNLAPNATIGDLITFFKGFNKKARFRCEQKTLEDGSTVRYAVADFENDKYALKMMEKFSCQEFHGRALIIREYLYRSYNNERRAVNWREKPWRAGERRRNDRRCKEAIMPQDDFEKILASSRDKEETLDEQVEHIKVQAYGDFARKN